MGLIARNYKFLSSYDISYKLKIQVANSIIFSILSYGQEIMSISSDQRKKFEKVISKVYRIIFHQPFSTKAEALALIAGQRSLKSSRMLSRIINHYRIENLPNHRTLKKLLRSDTWSANTYTYGKHQSDMNSLKRAQKSSSIDRDTFLDSINNFEQKKSKSVFKQILTEDDFTSNIRILNEDSHTSSLTKFFNPCADHPILTTVVYLISIHLAISIHLVIFSN